jgi:hypothetical protein
MTDVDTVIADYHAGRAERDPYDDLGVLIAEVERLRAQRQTVLEPQPGRRYEAVDERCNHIVDVIEWDDGGATIICLGCGAEAAGPTPDHAFTDIEHGAAVLTP